MPKEHLKQEVCSLARGSVRLYLKITKVHAVVEVVDLPTLMLAWLKKIKLTYNLIVIVLFKSNAL